MLVRTPLGATTIDAATKSEAKPHDTLLQNALLLTALLPERIE
jgi:hypothetical protein